MNSEIFLNLGNAYTKSSSSSIEVALRRFKSFFGVTPDVCLIVWEQIKHDAPKGGHPKHLLWSLSFLKQYLVEHCARSVFNADEKTIRKWTWVFVELLSNLNIIIWEKRFEKSVNGQTCYCSLDGVDFRILEPQPFSRQWYSHKINGPGLRYEVALNIRTGHIVWVNGPFPCGLYPDLKIAYESYVLCVNTGERTLADLGYKNETYFILPNVHNSKQHKLIMSRHETVNKRMKQFSIMKQPFRHNLTNHSKVFRAVANVTQLMIENGHPLFSVL